MAPKVVWWWTGITARCAENFSISIVAANMIKFINLIEKPRLFKIKSQVKNGMEPRLFEMSKALKLTIRWL